MPCACCRPRGFRATKVAVQTALFAHVDKTHLNHEGHVHTTRLMRWLELAVPLPDRCHSAKCVPAEHLPQFGATKEERYDNLLEMRSPLAPRVAGEAKRITPVMETRTTSSFRNVHCRRRLNLVGDTAGFIDPVFSSGLFPWDERLHFTWPPPSRRDSPAHFNIINVK